MISQTLGAEQHQRATVPHPVSIRLLRYNLILSLVSFGHATRTWTYNWRFKLIGRHCSVFFAQSRERELNKTIWSEKLRSYSVGVRAHLNLTSVLEWPNYL